MRIYYFNSRTSKNIPADNPIEMGFVEAKKVLNSLHGSDSFMGGELSNNVVLQFYSEEGAFWMELLDEQKHLAKGCNVSLPIAETALEAAFQGKDIETALLAAGYNWLEWKEEDLKPENI